MAPVKALLVAASAAVTWWYLGGVVLPLITALVVVLSLAWIWPVLLGSQPADGAVVITGCDPGGIGELTAIQLAQQGFHVFAGVLQPASVDLLQKNAVARGSLKGSLVAFQCDLTKLAEIEAAVETVRADIGKNKAQKKGVVGIINVAALGYTGPVEYFPPKRFQHQLEVNLVGPYQMVQAFFPLLRECIEGNASTRTRGRILFFGTGGGVPSPSPPLLSAYMASKWGTEAVCQSLRLECQLRKYAIDVGMINPGFIKPTNLGPVGVRLLETVLSEAKPQAKREYGDLIDRFLAFSDAQPGTHPTVVATETVRAFSANDFKLRTKVGFDSKASPIVGLLPTEWREALLRKSMFEAVPVPEGSRKFS